MKRFISSVLCLSLLLPGAVHAFGANDGIDITLSPDISKNIYIHAENLEQDFKSSVQVLKKGISPQNLWESAEVITEGSTAYAELDGLLFYADEAEPDRDGVYERQITINETGDYTIFISGDEQYASLDFTVYGLNEIIDELNSGDKIKDVTPYLGDFIKENKSLWNSEAKTGFYYEFVDSPEKKQYMTGKMKKKNISDENALKDRIKEAVILTVVKYPSVYSNVKKVIEEFKDYLGISGELSDNMQVYKDISGRDFESREALSAAYNSAVNTSSGSGGGGGSSGGGGGGGKSSSQSPARGAAVMSGSGEKREQIKMPFVDLDTVEWAYEAISTLYNEGIISGKSDTKYCPSDKITRAEFIKLVLGAIGEKAEASDRIFSDVPSDSWYCAYVNTGSRIGLIKGIDNINFGPDSNITREDITVILSRALKYKGKNLQSAEISFKDKDSISSYAFEAVGVLYGAGIIKGTDSGNFNPKNEATRAEAAKMIFGIYEMLK